MPDLFSDSSSSSLPANSETTGIQTDPLTLQLDDADFVRIHDQRLTDATSFYESPQVRLTERRKEIMAYLMGRQNWTKVLKRYEMRYPDNVLWEIEASLKPLAFSRMPDITVQPGANNEESNKVADDLTKIVNNEMSQRERRKVVSQAWRHFPVNFTGVIKVRWDPTKGQDGDVVFECVHPQDIVVDYTAKSNDTRDMQYINQTIELTVKECIAQFPEAKEDLFAVLGYDEADKQDESKLATPIKVSEVHFRWIDQGKGKDKFQQTIGIAWKYKSVILKKMKTPNWDYEGQNKLFTYDTPTDVSTKRLVTDAELRGAIMTGLPVPNSQEEQVYYNYLEEPDFPYFFFGYEQWGRMPYDETSRLEQLLQMQKILDQEEKQLSEMIAMGRGKHVWSADSGLKKEDIQSLDMSDPNKDIWVKGNIGEVHEYIQPELPSPAIFNNIESTRTRMFAKAGVEASRGEIQTDVATSNQIARESDYNRADDIVEETINACYEWMAKWWLHLVKMRYTSNHLRRLLGDDGKTVFLSLNRDMIQDGMEVTISSSGTDKLKAAQRAVNNANLQLTDPFNYFKDTNQTDPAGRTEALLLLQNYPALYIEHVLEGKDIGEMTAAIKQDSLQSQAPQAGAPPQSPGAPTAAGPATPTAPPPIQQPQPGNTQGVPFAPPTNAPQGSVRNING